MSNVLDLKHKMHTKLKKWRRVSIPIRLLNEKNQALEQFPAVAIKDDDRPIRQGQARGSCCGIIMSS